MRYDRSPILRERVACGGTNSSEFFAFDTSQNTILAGSNNALATIFDDAELSYALSYDPKAPESAPQQHLGQRRPCEAM